MLIGQFVFSYRMLRSLSFYSLWFGLVFFFVLLHGVVIEKTHLNIKEPVGGVASWC